MTLQRRAVIVDAVEHDGRNREHHARRREFPLGENVMNQAAMHTPVAVLERMDIDETEGGRGSLQDGVEAVIAHAVVCFQQTVHEILQISGLAPMNSGIGSP